MFYRLRQIFRKKDKPEERGIALLEALFCLSLFGILGLGFAQSLIMGYYTRLRMIHRSVALQVASDEMERLARLRANSLTAGTTTSTVVKGNMTFQQVVTITASTASGFDITVAVTDLNSRIGGTTQLQNKLIPYGSS
jgi:Tfp pilus assembly protein PilV